MTLFVIYYVAEPAAPSTQYANRMSTKVDTQLAPEEAEEAAQSSELSTGTVAAPLQIIAGDDRKATPANNPTSTFTATAASPANLSTQYYQHSHSFPCTRYRPAPLHTVQPDLAPHHVGR